ncbi:helix-turn-helix domain-containing protein [uncultured Roseibium sp.]|uniref:helix-turn-helix domain-containing protein n=1 Tax=uncultured Roseibium sp. TaxID=1936171 RepID=UPI00321638C2
MKLLDISEVAALSGTKASALRYYEDQGLIASVGRRGLKRLFEPSVIQQLAFITLGKSAGFSLEEIAAMLGPAGAPRISRDKLNARADELDQQIKKLTHLKDAIRHVADCPHPSHMDCPKFRRLLDLGTRKKKIRTKAAPRALQA